jgi:UDP-N-acetylglucosamine--N-acetylmuramyl-(pentapeptide) pyrophosphoryl-undecaprenol N-acetylglucosamine transferase
VPIRRTVGGLLGFWRGWRQTQDMVRHLIKDRAPVAVLGLGGYAAGVAVKLAGANKIPAAILNPDVIPGSANKYLMRYASAVCCQFEATRDHVASQHHPKLRVTGCPVRDDIGTSRREEALKRLGLERRLHTLVVTGASQGALTVNEAVLESLRKVKLQGWQILHLAGKEHAEAVRAGYRELEADAVVVDFTPAMADVWAVADLAIARSGASTCAELTTCGVPSILMPYPFHKDMHQRANAKVLENANAAMILDDHKDRKANAARLVPLLQSLLYDATRRQTMAANAHKLAHPAASDAVATTLLDLANQSPR